MSKEILKSILKNDRAQLDKLLNDGADITEVTQNEKWNYLHRALISITMVPSVEMIRHLVKLGVDVNAIDTFGNSPLIYAARLKKLDLITTLVQSEADINIVNAEGVSPLRQLLLSKPYDYPAIKFLIQSGADINQKIEKGLSVKEFAQTTSGGDPELLSLFDMKLNPNARKIVLDGSEIKTEADLWVAWTNQIDAESARYFGKNLSAFKDAITGGGPGFPGECVVILKYPSRLKKNLDSKKYGDLTELLGSAKFIDFRIEEETE